MNSGFHSSSRSLRSQLLSLPLHGVRRDALVLFFLRFSHSIMGRNNIPKEVSRLGQPVLRLRHVVRTVLSNPLLLRFPDLISSSSLPSASILAYSVRSPFDLDSIGGLILSRCTSCISLMSVPGLSRQDHTVGQRRTCQLPMTEAQTGAAPA